jgi:hypothetical protein
MRTQPTPIHNSPRTTAALGPQAHIRRSRSKAIMTSGLDLKYLMCGLAYAAGGMGLGIFMGSSHDHRQLVTHAHMLLVGFVLSLLYAIIHKLWLTVNASPIAWIQFCAHQAGAAIMTVGLLVHYGASTPPQMIEPALALASIAVLAAALLMLILVARVLTGETENPGLQRRT